MEESDIPRVARLQKEQWDEELKRSGLSPVVMDENPNAEGVSCPACGTTAPLVNGACSDCGLVLG